jgi:hypothetical protein
MGSHVANVIWVFVSIAIGLEWKYEISDTGAFFWKM